MEVKLEGKTTREHALSGVNLTAVELAFYFGREAPVASDCIQVQKDGHS